MPVDRCARTDHRHARENIRHESKRLLEASRQIRQLCRRPGSDFVIDSEGLPDLACQGPESVGVSEEMINSEVEPEGRWLVPCNQQLARHLFQVPSLVSVPGNLTVVRNYLLKEVEVQSGRALASNAPLQLRSTMVPDVRMWPHCRKQEGVFQWAEKREPPRHLDDHERLVEPGEDIEVRWILHCLACESFLVVDW